MDSSLSCCYQGPYTTFGPSSTTLQLPLGYIYAASDNPKLPVRSSEVIIELETTLDPTALSLDSQYNSLNCWDENTTYTCV
eukprot:c34318_g1_i1 orf=362-604(-)